MDFGYGEGERTFFGTLDTLYWDALQLLTSVQNTHTHLLKYLLETTLSYSVVSRIDS